MNNPAAIPTSSPAPPPARFAAVTDPKDDSWILPYLNHLADHCDPRIAAKAAGIKPHHVVERRRTDHIFAAQESRILAATPEFLFSEAMRRTLRGLNAPVDRLAEPGEELPSRPGRPPFGSDRILTDLLAWWVPGFKPARRTHSPHQTETERDYTMDPNSAQKAAEHVASLEE